LTFKGNLAEMSTLLWKMEETGEVDLTIVPKIDESMSLLTELQNKIVDNKATELKQDFLAYHIVRNINLTLEKMKSRFLDAKKNHDNPIVAEDSLAMIPVLAESFQVAENIMNGQLTTTDQRMIIERVRVLRDSMFTNSILVSGDEETARVSKTELDAEGKRLATAIQEIYTQELQDIS
jgi:hypothetical protein